MSLVLQPRQLDHAGCSGSSCGQITKRCCEKLGEWCDWLRGVHIHRRAFGTILRRRQSVGWEDAYQEWFETELEKCNSRWFEESEEKRSTGFSRQRTRSSTRKRTGTEGSIRSRRSAPPINGRSFDVSVAVDSEIVGDSFFEVRSDDGEDSELYDEPPEYLAPRRGAVSAEAHGTWNILHAAFTAPYFRKTEEIAKRIREILKECPFMYSVDADALQAIVEALPMEHVQKGDCIMRQGEHGDAAFIVLTGAADVYIEPPGKTAHFAREARIEDEDRDDEGSEIFDGGCDERALESPSANRIGEASSALLDARGHDTIPAADNEVSPTARACSGHDRCKECGSIEVGEREFVRTITTGRLFGEMSMLWSRPRTRSVYAREDCMLSKITREVFQNLVVRHNMSEREKREECLRQVTVFETLSDEQISQLADALEKQSFGAGEDIIRQGDSGNEFFIVVSGECSVIVETGNAVTGLHYQNPAILGANSLFGERALIESTRRSATIRTLTPVEVFRLKRQAFERMLGSLSHLHVQHYLSDPRKCLADFFKPGGQSGPRASMFRGGGISAAQVAPWERTEWFAVYRPTSRDAIAKMIGGTAVGKGLNVKGKSSKKNRLSGFVPFLQISDNSHKNEIEQSPPDARLNIFYTSPSGRATALALLQAWLPEDAHLQITTEREIFLLNDYQGVYGLDVPEIVMRKVYIEQPDLSPLAGWETGRKSEPAFMDMNLHAIRGNVEPEVVLYQHDSDNPLNPHGLLIAYAELLVKPVVSDFDTFTIGSKGMKYESLPSEQARLAMWSLQHTLEILKNPGADSWNSRWLEVLRKANEEGLHIDMPEYGFGDATSSTLIRQVVNWTSATGAVRHGAESFNFHFPQELDEEYLIIWEHFPDRPWAYKTEEELRYFLLERVRDGFSFPLNPVWPVRDKGWYEIFEALRESEDAAMPTMQSWYPASSGIAEKIDAIHAEFPDCFSNAFEELDGEEQGQVLEEALEPDSPRKRLRTQKTKSDLDLCEKADLGLYKLGVKAARWRRTIKSNLRRLNSKHFPPIEGDGQQIDLLDACNERRGSSANEYEYRPSTSCRLSGIRTVRFQSDICGTVEENLDEDLSTIASAPEIIASAPEIVSFRGDYTIAADLAESC